MTIRGVWIRLRLVNWVDTWVYEFEVVTMENPGGTGLEKYDFRIPMD